MSKLTSQEEKERFMRKAVEISKEGALSGLGAPFGAVIVKDGKVIGKARLCRPTLIVLTYRYFAYAWQSNSIPLDAAVV